MKTKLLISFFCTVQTFFFIFIYFNSIAQVNMQDFTFGNNGVVTSELGSSSDEAYSICLQSDGKIILVGNSYMIGHSAFTLVRYNTDGSIDTTFGNNGKVTTSIGNIADWASCATLQLDGKIVVGGKYYHNDGIANEFVVIRYNPNGSLDSTFGISGIVKTDLGNEINEFYAICIQSNGKILITGETGSGSNRNIPVICYNSDGTLDNSFGLNGIVITDLGHVGDIGHGICILSNNEFIITGGTGDNFALLKYLPNGNLDSTFGLNGIILTDFISCLGEEANSLCLQPDGKIIVAGWGWFGGNCDFIIARYFSNGNLDSSFGINGKTNTDFGTQDDRGKAIIYQSNGKIIVSGYSGFNNNNVNFAITRYNNDGSVDITFGNNGKIITSITSYNDYPTSMSLQLDGNIIVSGYSGYSSNSNFAMVRYLGNLTLLSNPSNKTICEQQNTSFYVTAVNTSGYQWQYYNGSIWGNISNGGLYQGVTNDTLQLTNIPLYLNNCQYRCVVTDSTTFDTSAIALLTVNTLPIADAGIDKSICIGQPTQLSASGGIIYYWETNSSLSATNIYNPIANPTLTNEYIVTVTDTNGCSAIDSVSIIVQNVFQNEEICLVTVDTITWKNKIMWEKTTNVGTEYYLIYKENGLNNYVQIGNVQATQPSEFIDLFSVPESHGDKYKITVLDTCGNESDLSYFHKTMNLVISSFGSTMGLMWDDYVDESGTYSPFRYYIYRGTSPSNMSLLDSVSGSFNTYNDVNVFSVYYYIIGVKKLGGCNTTKSNIISFSNKKDNSTLLGINNSTFGTIKVSPNPFSEQTTIEIPNFQNSNSKSQITITDVTGKTVRTYSTLSAVIASEGLTEAISTPQNQIATNLSGSRNDAQIIIERGNLKAGVYFIELRGDRLYRGKLIVE